MLRFARGSRSVASFRGEVDLLAREICRGKRPVWTWPHRTLSGSRYSMFTRALRTPLSHGRRLVAGPAPRRPSVRALVALLGCISLLAALGVNAGPAAASAQPNPDLKNA